MIILMIIILLMIKLTFFFDLWINMKYFSLSREIGHYFQENGLFFIKKRNDALIDIYIRKRVTYGSLSIKSPNEYAKMTYGNKNNFAIYFSYF